MQNINNLTREDIINALNYIESNNIRLNESIYYNVTIKDKNYPPKEIIKYALNLLNKTNFVFIYEYKGIIELLAKLGFNISIKVNVWKLGTRWGRGAVS